MVHQVKLILREYKIFNLYRVIRPIIDVVLLNDLCDLDEASGVVKKSFSYGEHSL